MGSPEKDLSKREEGHDQVFISKAEELRDVLSSWRVWERFNCTKYVLDTGLSPLHVLGNSILSTIL